MSLVSFGTTGYTFAPFGKFIQSVNLPQISGKLSLSGLGISVTNFREIFPNGEYLSQIFGKFFRLGNIRHKSSANFSGMGISATNLRQIFPTWEYSPQIFEKFFQMGNICYKSSANFSKWGISATNLRQIFSGMGIFATNLQKIIKFH
jgi:hypothetical protein